VRAEAEALLRVGAADAARALLTDALQESRAIDAAEAEAAAAGKAMPADHALRWGWNGSAPELGADSGRVFATAVHAYAPRAKGRSDQGQHLPLNKGDRVEVLPPGLGVLAAGPCADRLGRPWALGRVRGRTGWFPSAYVKRLPAPGERSPRTVALVEMLARAIDRRPAGAWTRGGGEGPGGDRGGDSRGGLEPADGDAVVALLHPGEHADAALSASPLPAAVLGFPVDRVLEAHAAAMSSASRW